VRAAVDGLAPRASVACPLARRWARTLSDEFKSGACHAGRYETSLVLAANEGLVDEAARAALPALDVSLSTGIRSGKRSFREMGLEHAYTGAPADATREEGDDLLGRLATMIETEVLEALGAQRKDKP
jgi:creatinine amidohydrolase